MCRRVDRRKFNSGRATIGDRNFWVSLSGKWVMMDFHQNAVRFHFKLTQTQWRGFVKLLKNGMSHPAGYAACAGFLFSTMEPIYYSAERTSRNISIGKQQTTTTPNPKRELQAMKRTHWSNPVTLGYENMCFFISRDYFLNIRDICLKASRFTS